MTQFSAGGFAATSLLLGRATRAWQEYGKLTSGLRDMLDAVGVAGTSLKRPR